MNDTFADGNQSRPEEAQACCGSEAGCPMASMYGEFFERRTSRFLLMLPGAVLILLGVAILVQPKVLIWLVAGAAVLMGVAMLLMVNFMYRFGARARGAGG